MKISIIGSGYVGLVSGTCLAETGVTTACIDIDAKKIEGLQNGIIPIYEPGLENMVKRNQEKGTLRFSTNLKDSLQNVDVVFSAVGTPPDEDGSADLQYVLAVAKEVGMYMQDYLVMVTKSTVPVGTAVKVKKAIQDELDKRGVDIVFDVASNPEFLKEGDAINDFLKPDRIVIGIESDRAKKLLERLYRPFILNGNPVLFMDIPSAELTKYAANSMLATKISFMNDIANLCEIVGANIDDVRMGIGSDTRIGKKFLYAGTGYGGSCFPKDVKALISTADELNYSLDILKAVEDVNYRQKSIIFNKVNVHFNGELKGKRFALWGLSFKPNTDDMRDAPALVLIEKLLAAGATVNAYDPEAINESKRRIGNIINYASNQYEALTDADALIIMTEWNEFRVPKFRMVEKLLGTKLIFDGRNIYNPEEMKEFGYKYYSIGRKTV